MSSFKTMALSQDGRRSQFGNGDGSGLGAASAGRWIDHAFKANTLGVWILNETLRVESYNLGPIPAGVAGPLDHPPLTR